MLQEEASRLDEAVFKEVVRVELVIAVHEREYVLNSVIDSQVLPLTGVANTSLIGISTPLDENNFYSVMLEMKNPDGTPLFKARSASR